ncbi:regulation of nuclear pre-mRNA domain-containing protein 1B-like [Clavelina lepadiformis]|uniref:regulation of nuclear pre-mRNA domain-containing protein 1B-like n=1 Tax=Clavelina lepadiformis TaxID=159417 RepID=UPI004042F2FB
MSTFSESALIKKLSDLNNSQQSIQTLSLWVIHHRKHARTIVQVWQTELIKAKIKKKLTFLYLANDVIQNSRKKGPEFTKSYGGVLITAFTHVAKHSDEKTKQSIGRMLDIWVERNIYDADYIAQIRQSVSKVFDQKFGTKTTQNAGKPSAKKRKTVKNEKKDDHEVGQKKSRLEELIDQNEDDDYLTLSPRDPPEADELAKALLDLETAASSDAVVREKIASLPPEVQDVSRLEQISERETADKLCSVVEEACMLLAEYNGRLVAEIEDRRQVARMLADFMRQQKSLLHESEQKLADYREKLAKVAEVRKELKSHIQNLPDLRMLPSVTGGLAPLPSAGDLFN